MSIGEDRHAAAEGGAACDAGEARGGSGGSGHSLRGSGEALSQMDVLSDGVVKRLVRVTYAGALAGCGLLVALFAMNVSRDFDSLPDTRPVVVLNTAVAAFDLALLTACGAKFLARLRAVRLARMQWSARRMRFLTVFCVQLGSAYVSNLFLLIPNAYVAARRCGYFMDVISYSGLVRWTAWNTLLAFWVVEARHFNLIVDGLGHPVGGREDQMLLDAPWSTHRFVAAYWLAFQAIVAGHVLHFESESDAVACEGDRRRCNPALALVLLTAALIVMSFGYFVLFVFYARRAFLHFSKKSYIQFRWQNVSLRFTYRMVGVVLLFGVLSFAFLWLIRINSCMSYVTSWLGFVPLQMVLTLFMAVNTIMTLPLKPGVDVGGRGLRGGETWLERDAAAHRMEAVEASGADFCPMFCFETAVKLVYWCEVLYQYKPQGGQGNSRFTLEMGMSLYDLTHVEHIVSREMDTYAMVSWNKAGTILVCFRGTKSSKNLMANLKFWRTPHWPVRGCSMCSTCPMVHKGFYQSWQREAFDQKVLKHVRLAMADPDFDIKNLHIFVSGHSLGGAVAVLAAHDIRRWCGVAAHQISCYTFGCPRVGNHRFAAEHDRILPDTWHVINNLDAIPRMPKFWLLFKRCGKKVMVNSQGDMIVSPIFLEFKLTSVFMGNMNIGHHKLSSYLKSLSAVALAQFHTYKAIPGGSVAIRELLDKGDITNVLGVSSKSADRLMAMASKIWTLHSHNIDLGGLEPDIHSKPSDRSSTGVLPFLRRWAMGGSSSSSSSWAPALAGTSERQSKEACPSGVDRDFGGEGCLEEGSLGPLGGEQGSEQRTSLDG